MPHPFLPDTGCVQNVCKTHPECVQYASGMCVGQNYLGAKVYRIISYPSFIILINKATHGKSPNKVVGSNPINVAFNVKL